MRSAGAEPTTGEPADTAPSAPAPPARVDSGGDGDSGELRRGTLFGFSAYLLWGGMPLYFVALAPAGAFEILAHRILWSVAFCAVVLLVLRRGAWLRRLLAHPRRLAAVALAGAVIATNWTIYTYAAISGHVTEASLGYFLNPLVTVAMGVLILSEKLRRLQWVAVGIGLVAVVYLTIDYGGLPWISVCLALSFATYGLLKKRIGGSMSALQSLTAETMILAPFAALLLLFLTVQGHSTFTVDGPWHGLLLASAGVATAVPLLLFAAAARRVPLVTIGLLQFVTPVLQLLAGVLLLGETMGTSRWIGFAIVWLALLVLSVDSVHSARSRARRLARAAEGAAV